MSASVRNACVECGAVAKPHSCPSCGLEFCRKCLKDHGDCVREERPEEAVEENFSENHGFSGLVGWVGDDWMARATLVGVAGARLSGLRCRPPDR